MQANTARVVFSWNDNDPTTPDRNDAMRHMVRGSASLNLLGGLPDPPPEPADTRSFTFRVNNVCALWCVCVFALWNTLIIIGTQNLIHETNKL